MKYLKALLTLLLCSALLCACAPDENAQTAAAPTAAPVLLGFSQLGSESAWRVGSTRSIEEAAERHGVSLMMLNAYQKQEKQIDAIRSFISYRVDVISFAPIVEDGWDTVLTEAKAAGIPVILVDRLITTEDESLYACFVGADFIKEGRSAGEFLLKKADAMGAEHLNIVEITGTEDSTPQRQRHQGFHDTIAGDERFTVLESISGDFLVSKGEECMRYLLDKYGEDIDVLYSHNDGMTLGAIDAIREYGLSPGSDIIIITVDGEQAAIDLLKAGEINCVVECTPNLGDSVMELAKKLAAGEDVPRMSHPRNDRLSTNISALCPMVIFRLSANASSARMSGCCASRYGIMRYSYDLTMPGMTSKSDQASILTLTRNITFTTFR